MSSLARSLSAERHICEILKQEHHQYRIDGGVNVMDESIQRRHGYLSRSKWNGARPFAIWIQILYMVATLVGLSTAAFVTFENCLSPNIIGSDPRQLQFRPLFVNARFNTTAPSHNLNVTVYGNVSGSTTNEALPRFNDPRWRIPNETLGKIPELDISNNKYTTLKAAFKVLDYTPYTADPLPFCSQLIKGQCPLAPSFLANA